MSRFLGETLANSRAMADKWGRWLAKFDRRELSDAAPVDLATAMVARGSERFSARVVDVLMALVPCVLAAWGARLIAVAVGIEGMARSVMLLSGVMVAYLAYEGFFISAFGTTPGKAILSIEVVDIETCKRPSLRRSLFRCAPLLMAPAPAVGPLLVLVFYSSAFWGKRRGGRGWHDRLAKTTAIVSGTGVDRRRR